jgi:hypothetical protein
VGGDPSLTRRLDGTLKPFELRERSLFPGHRPALVLIHHDRSLSRYFFPG